MSALWQDIARAAGVLGEDGRPGATIFAEMTALAQRTGAINLGQGAPGTPADPLVAQAAIEAIQGGVNQYPPVQGNPVLLEAVQVHQQRFYGRQVATEEIVVTTGATEALFSAILALAPAGSEVVVFEPYYDSYAAAAAAAGASVRTVPLDPVGFGFDPAALEAAVSERTSVIVVNDPHNPTGKVFRREELELIVAAAQAHDAWIVTDEVYEHLVFDDLAHVPVATLPGAAERTVTISSAGKTFNVTGWKVGWAIAPAEVRAAIQSIKQYTTFVSAGPFQPAVAAGLAGDDASYAARAESLQHRRDLLLAGLARIPGLRTGVPGAGYFAIADFSEVTDLDARSIIARMAELIGIVAVPVPALCAPGSVVQEQLRGHVRFSFCQSHADMAEAAERLAGLDPSRL
ncbi:aminotransferase class I/II-fold pyridoxal phosphate-dependent enzyme [Sediminivirga luteola]|uniref:Aminotransferase n=1 Tax=Sediminivirga luteola TaxID=1774748 RepID=A0A8J2TWD1_9MICO|nr:aminotransferase class I/II-fold pyridoxal phosphate-dependent enzyme [Sediminivirga luteola]MCI2265662.1 aminotransferase class I/II-fold pyridoxal phosphate-dependent enzyme [Sediminivirga luteola]GGA07573.1 aminotransferase [Sediminivirga luteola]